MHLSNNNPKVHGDVLKTRLQKVYDTNGKGYYVVLTTNSYKLKWRGGGCNKKLDDGNKIWTKYKHIEKWWQRGTGKINRSNKRRRIELRVK